MNEQTKSIIRHALTALGAIIGFLGLGKYTGVLEYVNTNLDSIWEAVLTIVGFVTAILGFFQNKARFTFRG